MPRVAGILATLLLVLVLVLVLNTAAAREGQRQNEGSPHRTKNQSIKRQSKLNRMMKAISLGGSGSSHGQHKNKNPIADISSKDKQAETADYATSGDDENRKKRENQNAGYDQPANVHFLPPRSFRQKGSARSAQNDIQEIYFILPEYDGADTLECTRNDYHCHLNPKQFRQIEDNLALMRWQTEFLRSLSETTQNTLKMLSKDSHRTPNPLVRIFKPTSDQQVPFCQLLGAKTVQALRDQDVSLQYLERSSGFYDLCKNADSLCQRLLDDQNFSTASLSNLAKDLRQILLQVETKLNDHATPLVQKSQKIHQDFENVCSELGARPKRPTCASQTLGLQLSEVWKQSDKFCFDFNQKFPRFTAWRQAKDNAGASTSQSQRTRQ